MFAVAQILKGSECVFHSYNNVYVIITGSRDPISNLYVQPWVSCLEISASYISLFGCTLSFLLAFKNRLCLLIINTSQASNAQYICTCTMYIVQIYMSCMYASYFLTFLYNHGYLYEYLYLILNIG